MNKQKPIAFLIIVSIFVLALKDSASFIHAVLHYIPDNPWHRHEVITGHDHHHVDPLSIHTYLQHKHAHNHGAHIHTHSVLDHIPAADAENENNTHSEEIKAIGKIDFYFQPVTDLYMCTYIMNKSLSCSAIYNACIIDRSIRPPSQPPQI